MSLRVSQSSCSLTQLNEWMAERCESQLWKWSKEEKTRPRKEVPWMGARDNSTSLSTGQFPVRLENLQDAAIIGYLTHSSALKDLQTVKCGFLIPGNVQGHLGWGLEQPGLVKGWNQVVFKIPFNPNNSMILWNVKPHTPVFKHTKSWLCLQASTGVLLVPGLSCSDLQECSHTWGQDAWVSHVHFYLMVIPENISWNNSTMKEHCKRQ